MMSEYYTYECKYKHKFPDEFDVPGGMFSMADPPINGHKVLEREGIYDCTRSQTKTISQVEDKEKGWTFHTFKDVIIGDLDPGRRRRVCIGGYPTCSLEQDMLLEATI